MIVILPTGTGFLVGTLPMKNKNNRLQKLQPQDKRTRKHLAKYWTEVRRWMRAAKQPAN